MELGKAHFHALPDGALRRGGEADRASWAGRL